MYNSYGRCCLFPVGVFPEDDTPQQATEEAPAEEGQQEGRGMKEFNPYAYCSFYAHFQWRLSSSNLSFLSTYFKI